jgi:2',3'-cyclic-nucleotide 2'-phosphodiesterase (5'-nucleotidase family)
MIKMITWVLLVACTGTTAFSETLSLIASRNLSGDVSQILGVGNVASAVRNSGTASLLFDLGGVLSPAEQAFEHRRKGSLTVDLMNRSGYAAWFLGGRDLAWSNRLTQFLRRTEFPVLAANLHRPETGRHLFQVQPYTIVRVDSRRIGLVGLSGPADGVLSSDPVEAARYYVSLISERCDLVIVVSSAGPEADTAIASSVEGVDLVIGEDTTSGVLKTERGWVVATTGGSGLWGIDLEFADGEITAVVANSMAIPKADRGSVNQAFLGWTAELEGEPVSLGTVIGQSEGGFQATLTSPLGYFVADLIHSSAKTDGALVKANHFPADFVTGDITVYDLFRAYPLPFTVGVASIKGADLVRMIALVNGEPQYYPSGVDVVYGVDGGEGGVVESMIGGKPIDLRVDYTIAIENGALELSGVRVRDTGVRIRDLFGRHIRTSESVKGVVDGRIQRR